MFKGKSILDKKNIKDVTRVVCKRVRTIYTILAATGCIVLLGLLIKNMWDANKATRIVLAVISLLAMGMVVAICIFGYKYVYKKVTRRFEQQIETVYHTDNIEKEVIFENDHVLLVTKPEAKELFLKDVKSCLETKRNLIFRFKGDLYLWIDKKSIEGGNLLEFKAYLSNYIQKMP